MILQHFLATICSCRATSISSFLNRTVSFSQLNTDKEEEERGGEGDSSRSPGGLGPSKDVMNLSTSSTNLSKSLTSISTLGSTPHGKLLEEDGQLSMSSGNLNQTADSALSPEHCHGNRAVDSVSVDDREMESVKGGYLGRFTNERRGKSKVYIHYMQFSDYATVWWALASYPGVQRGRGERERECLDKTPAEHMHACMHLLSTYNHIRATQFSEVNF